MDFYGYVDLAIAFLLIILLLCIITSGINEMIMYALKARGKFLKEVLQHVLKDPKNKDFANSLYNHPLIAVLKKNANSLPSYISSGTFSTAMIDIIGKEAASPDNPTPAPSEDPLAQFKTGIAAMKDSELKTILTTIVQYSKTADELKQNFAKWFDDYMDRVSGWYKSRQQVWLFIIGLLVAVVLNVDCFRLVKELNDNSVLREHMAQAAENYVSTHEPEVTGNDSLQMIVKNIKDAYNQLDVNDLPIGWNKTPTTGNPFAGFWSVNQTYFINGTWVQTISGWLITAGLLSFGSPFWFQLLNKLIDLRKAGKKPEQVNTTDQT